MRNNNRGFSSLPFKLKRANRAAGLDRLAKIGTSVCLPDHCKSILPPDSASLDLALLRSLYDLPPEVLQHRSVRTMSNVIEQELSVLSSSKQGLVYLTPNDWTLVVDKATRVTFPKGQTMVYKGKRSNGVYLLVKGIARVQILTRNIRPEIGPGQICGEMSFLDNAPASANVIAHDNVEAYYIDRGTLEGLFELFPHLASRFYRSLATNLSNRLRDVIGPGAETLSANTAPIPPRVSFPALKNSKR